MGFIAQDNAVTQYTDTPEDGKPATIFAWPEDHMVTTYSQIKVEVPFWETLGGAWACDTSDSGQIITWLRLASGKDPRKLHVEISQGGAVIFIDNVAHIILRGLEISNGDTGVKIHGSSATDNLIDDCYIKQGSVRISITGKAARTTVQNSTIAMAFIGTRPGAWGKDSQQSGRCEYVYNFFKRLSSTHASSNDRSIRIQTGAMDTLIQNNHFDGGLVAITSVDNKNLTIRNNVIHDFSSVGLSIITGSVNTRIHDNLVYNCNKNVRLHRLNQGRGFEVYIYNNRFFEPDGRGEHIYTHALADKYLKKMKITQPTPDPIAAIYHNTFIGGHIFISLTTRLKQGFPELVFANNVLSSQLLQRWIKADTLIGMFDYNWLGGSYVTQDQAWMGKHNIFAQGQLLSQSMGEQLPSFELPADSPARNAGLDLSKPLNVGNHFKSPLPGMKPGYFKGDRPDMGILPETR